MWPRHHDAHHAERPGPCVTWRQEHMTSTDKAANEQINGIRTRARHKAPHTQAREQRMHCICMCACVHAKPQTLTACKIVCLCRERDVRRRCGRDTTTRIMWIRPVCDDMASERTNGIRTIISQTQSAHAHARERMHVRMRACRATDTHSLQDRVFVSRA